MSREKTNSELLASFKKSNKERREAVAKKAGYPTAVEYLLFLTSGMVEKQEVVAKEKETVHVINILDLSSSMNESGRLRAALSGLNAETKSLKEDKSTKVLFSLITFSSRGTQRSVFNRRDINEVTVINERANGMTALYDTIKIVLKDIDNKKYSERTLVNIFTDGQDNVSTTKTWEVAKIVEESKKKGIIITFIGTERDILSVTQNLGLNSSNTLAHDNTFEGIGKAFTHKLAATASYRGSVSRGVKQEDLLTGFYKQEGKL